MTDDIGPELWIKSVVRQRRRDGRDRAAPIVVGGDSQLDDDGIPVGQCLPEAPIDGEYPDLHRWVVDALEETHVDEAEDLRIVEADAPGGVAIVAPADPPSGDMVTYKFDSDSGDGFEQPTRTTSRRKCPIELGELVIAGAGGGA